MIFGDSANLSFFQRLFDLRLRDLGKMLPIGFIAGLIVWIFWKYILGVPRLEQGADPPYLGLTIILLMNLGVLLRLLRKSSWSPTMEGSEATVQPAIDAFRRGRPVAPAPQPVAQPSKDKSFRSGHGPDASDRPAVVPGPEISSQLPGALPNLKFSGLDKVDHPTMVVKDPSPMGLPNRSARDSVLIELEEQDLSLCSVSFDEEFESNLHDTSPPRTSSAEPFRSTVSGSKNASAPSTDPDSLEPAPCTNSFSRYVVGRLSVNSLEITLEKSPSLATFTSSEFPLATQNRSVEPLEPAPSERPGELPVRSHPGERCPIQDLSLPSMAPPDFKEESKSFVCLGDASDTSPAGPLPSRPELAPDSSPVGLPPSSQRDPECQPSDALGSEERTASVLVAPENPHAEPSQEACRSSVLSPFPDPGEHHAECLPHDEPNRLDLAPFLSPRPSSVFDQIRVRLGLDSGTVEESPFSVSLDDLPLPPGCQAPSLNGSTRISAVSEPPRVSSLEALPPSTEPRPYRSESSTAQAIENVSAAVSPDRLLNGRSATGQSDFAKEFPPVMEGLNPVTDDRATPSMLPLAMNSPAIPAGTPTAASEPEGTDSPCPASPVEEGQPTLDRPLVPPQPNVVGLESPDLIKVLDDHYPSQEPVVPTGAVGTDLRTSGDAPSPEPLPSQATPGESGGKSSSFDSGVNEGTAISQPMSARSPSPFEDPATRSHGSSVPSILHDPSSTSSQETNLLQATNVEEISFPLDLNDIRTPSYDQLFQQERDFVDLVCRHLGILPQDLSENHYHEVLEGFWIVQSLDTCLASPDGLKFSVVQLMEIPCGGRTIDVPLSTSGEAFTGMQCVLSTNLQGVRGSLEVTPDALVLRNAHGIQVAPVAEIKGFQVFSDRLAIHFVAERHPWFLGMRAPSRLVLIVWHLAHRRGS